ncbi:MAG: hypothetical protein LIP77_01755 [Planctomycetes bacterium]|nr:hypothetical protein [Planctomycetota bacterium]
MAAKLDIINLALSRSGAARIDSLDEASKSGRTARLSWDTARDATLRGHEWGFAARRERLALLEDKPVGGRYAYAMPPDYIVIRRVHATPEAAAEDPGIPFVMRQVSGRMAIICDAAGAVADYTARVDNCELFDDIFTDALAWRLASDFAMALKSDVDSAGAAIQLADRLTAQASTANARERHQDEDGISSFERARWA